MMDPNAGKLLPKKMPRELKKFDPVEHVRPDWDAEDLIYLLEDRAQGYSGMLRNILCSAAAMLRRINGRT